MNLKKQMILAMIQPLPFPGSYKNNGETLQDIIDDSIREAKMLQDYGFDGYILQNRNDAPVLQYANVETTAYMTRLAVELKKEFPNLIQGILVNWDGVSSLAVADAAGSDFIRVEHTYTGVEVGYAGILHAQCIDILNLKKKIGTKIPIYADVQEIHYEQLCGKNYVDNAWDTVMNAFADGLYLAGKDYNESIEMIKNIRNRLGNEVPIYLGGGSTAANIAELLEYFDGVSVGTWVKDGNMRNPINPQKAKLFIDNAKKVKKDD